MLKEEIIREYFSEKCRFLYLLEAVEVLEKKGFDTSRQSKGLDTCNAELARMEDENPWLPAVIEAVYKII
jgi:hypothetical protein